MASLRQLSGKVKTFGDFKKVVNIQKIVVMKEIAEQRKIIKQLKFRDQLFNNLMLDLYKKHGAYEKEFFEAGASRVLVKRDLHFIITNTLKTTLGVYSNKLIMEFIRKNHRKDDLYVVVGRELSEMLQREGLKIINILPDKAADDPRTYERVASQVIRGYKDLMFLKSTFIFFDISTKQVSSLQLFPFSKKKIELNKEETDMFTDENEIIMGIKIRKTTWLRDIYIASEKIAKLAIQEKAFFVMTQYRLNAKIMELQSLDDKIKNIDDEIWRIKLKMQKVRQETVTNELLTNATAFGTINDKDGERW